jgi:hypothetical protein
MNSDLYRVFPGCFDLDVLQLEEGRRSSTDLGYAHRRCHLCKCFRPLFPSHNLVGVSERHGTGTDRCGMRIVVAARQYKIRPMDFIEFHLFGGLIEVRGKRWEQARELLELVSPSRRPARGLKYGRVVWLIVRSWMGLAVRVGGHGAGGEHFAVTDGSAYEARPRQPDHRGQGTLSLRPSSPRINDGADNRPCYPTRRRSTTRRTSRRR